MYQQINMYQQKNTEYAAWFSFEQVNGNQKQNQFK